MRKFYTAEAVTEGHPDKLCDQIADAILDVCLKQDEQSRVACEVLATKGTIIVAGEITSTYEPDVFAVVRKVLSGAGNPAGVWADSEADRGYPAPYPSYFPTDCSLRAFRKKRVSVGAHR